jgi:hypothetical protein
LRGAEDRVEKRPAQPERTDAVRVPETDLEIARQNDRDLLAGCVDDGLTQLFVVTVRQRLARSAFITGRTVARRPDLADAVRSFVLAEKSLA